MTRRSAGLRSPAQNCFYPQHAPIKEAIYVSTLSNSLPSLTTVSQKQSQHLKMANDDALARSESFIERAREETEQLSTFYSLQRSSIEKARKQEKAEQVQRMRDDREKREKRWVEKLGDHPFAVDQWKEDKKMYDKNRAKDKSEQRRRRMALEREIEDRGRQITKKCADVDQLDEFRKEKKLTLQSHKIVKTRQDLFRKEIRFGVVKSVPPEKTPSDRAESAVAIARTHVERLAMETPEDILRDSRFTVEDMRHPMTSWTNWYTHHGVKNCHEAMTCRWKASENETRAAEAEAARKKGLAKLLLKLKHLLFQELLEGWRRHTMREKMEKSSQEKEAAAKKAKKDAEANAAMKAADEKAKKDAKLKDLRRLQDWIVRLSCFAFAEEVLAKSMTPKLQQKAFKRWKWLIDKKHRDAEVILSRYNRSWTMYHQAKSIRAIVSIQGSFRRRLSRLRGSIDNAVEENDAAAQADVRRPSSEQ